MVGVILKLFLARFLFIQHKSTSSQTQVQRRVGMLNSAQAVHT